MTVRPSDKPLSYADVRPTRPSLSGAIVAYTMLTIAALFICAFIYGAVR